MKLKNLDRFKGTVVLGLNGDKDNHNAVAVWTLGAMLNEKSPEMHYWKSWDLKDLTPEFFKKTVVRHYPIGKPEIMSKSQLKKAIGISSLPSSQRGHKIYKDTNIGDVLYITYDTNAWAMQEAIDVGFIDKKCQIKLDK